MRKSERIRLKDLRNAFRLVHDCRDVGHDSGAWAAVLVEGLSRLVGAQLVIVGWIETGGPSPRSASLADGGWLSTADRAFWYSAHVDTQRFRQVSTFQRYVALPGRLVTRSRG